MSSIFEASPYDHALRQLHSCVSTLTGVAYFLEDIEDIEDADLRADLLIAVENLIDVSYYITERGRELAWRHSELPVSEDDI